MSTIVRTAAAASLLMFATSAIAQTQNPNAETRPLPPDQQNSQPYDTKQEPTNAPEAPGVGSRGIGPVEKEAPTDPNMPKQPQVKQLDKQGRGGHQN